MKLYNLTNSVLCFGVGNLKVQVEPNTCSNAINMTPESIKGSIIPLINMYGDKILLVLNSVEMSLIGKTGYHLPPENVVDHEYAQRQIEFNLNKAKTTSKVKDNISDQPRNDLKAGIPDIKNEVKPKDVVIPAVRVIPHESL